MRIKYYRKVFSVIKKWLAVTGLVILFGTIATIVFAASPIKLVVNGQETKPDIPLQLINGRTMVPVRWFAKAMGADVQWDGQNNTIIINKPYAVASVFEAKAKLYPFKEKSGMYDGFILEWATPCLPAQD